MAPAGERRRFERFCEDLGAEGEADAFSSYAFAYACRSSLRRINR